MYNTGNADNFTIKTESKVIFKDWYGLHPYAIDATFDFSKIPPELHQTLLNRLLKDYHDNRQGIMSTKKESQGWLGRILNKKLF